MSEQPEWDIDELVKQISGMRGGLFCWQCLVEVRVQPGTTAADWQAVTVVDGTALCVRHVIAKVRKASGRG